MSFPIPHFPDPFGLVSHKKRRRKKRGPQVCRNVALALFAAGASALIFATPMGKQLFEVDLIPTIYIDISQGTKILYYIESQSSKKGDCPHFFEQNNYWGLRAIIGGSPAPKVTYFSSRGPSSLSPNILKEYRCEIDYMRELLQGLVNPRPPAVRKRNHALTPYYAAPRLLIYW